MKHTPELKFVYRPETVEKGMRINESLEGAAEAE